MRVLVLYTPVGADAPPEDLDGLVQRDAIAEVLADQGHQVQTLGFALNLERMQESLVELKPECVFNLVESVAGCDRLLHLAPALLDAIGLPYTGSSLGSILLTTHKLMAKRALCANQLPTPEWIEPNSEEPFVAADNTRLIIKSAWDHGSANLDDTSLVPYANLAEIVTQLREHSRSPGQEWFAERYIDGREFNISVLAGEQGPQVLSPAEMCFEGYQEGKPRIVGYQAKWNPDSFEYQNTIRRFCFTSQDSLMLERLHEFSLRCWHLFGLRGYARVDFRVDRWNNPWILEVNANPCLSPDAGFAAALAQSGIPYPEAIRRILADCG